jgi:hypothetical protein
MVRVGNSSNRYDDLINYNIIALENINEKSVVNKFSRMHMYTFTPGFIKAVVEKSGNSGIN